MVALQVPVTHGILQARRLEWVAFPFSRVSSQPRDRTQVSCIAGGFLPTWGPDPQRRLFCEHALPPAPTHGQDMLKLVTLIVHHLTERESSEWKGQDDNCKGRRERVLSRLPPGKLSTLLMVTCLCSRALLLKLSKRITQGIGLTCEYYCSTSIHSDAESMPEGTGIYIANRHCRGFW